MLNSEASCALPLTDTSGATPFQQQITQMLYQGHQDQQQLLSELNDIKSLMTIKNAIPPQILFSSPVVLLDALG